MNLCYSLKIADVIKIGINWIVVYDSYYEYILLKCEKYRFTGAV
jgi:hypothetical protein